MAVCLKCGKETEGCLCGKCMSNTDIENLCGEISAYRPMVQDNPDKNPIWEKIASKMEKPYNFRNLAFAVADYLPSPRKEYQQIMSLVGTNMRVPRASKPWFYEVYDQIIKKDGLTKEEILRLKGLMLETLYQDYRYFEADELASELLGKSNLPWQTVYVIAEFFSQTRRYDEADDAITVGKREHADNDNIIIQFDPLDQKNTARRNAADTGKKEYLPNPKENKAEAVEKYKEFMESLGIDVEVSSTMFSYDGKVSKYPKPIPVDEYPDFVEKREADFDSFVAYDFETTGKFPGTDAIIEVGAVRVVNGKITETETFTFQEFVKPLKKKLPEEITKLTGITNDNLKDARPVWEVTPDFMKFVGNDIMVGYNNVKFDAQFLCRAGRYSNEIYTNKQFDVMRYAQRVKDVIEYTGGNFKLDTVGEFLGITNPEAHRALADAITTAKIYLKLKEMCGVSTPVSTEDVLDLEDW